MAGVGRLMYEERKYEECLAAFAAADKALDGAGRRKVQDLDAELVRVQALIRQQQLEDASKRLTRMLEWKGTGESEAQTCLLLGVIHLTNGDRDQALLMLQRVIERYPQASCAGKAKDMITRLK